MVRKIFFSSVTVLMMLVVLPGSGVFGLFTSQATATPNTFTTALNFSSPSPSVQSPSPTVVASSSPGSSSSPGVSPSLNPSVSPSVNPSTIPQPEFPVCPKEPGADVNGQHWNVGYAEGIHWIVFQGLKFGSDYVYFLGPSENPKNKVLQCYYPLPRSDSNIQTDWLKKTQDIPGWQTWLNGLDFGLNPGPYLIKNIDFSTQSIAPSPSVSPATSPSITPSPTSEATTSASPAV